MLELAVLGFLYEAPLHAYELRSRISGLTGHIRPVSDGALYPALTRLQKAGLLRRRAQAGSRGQTRQVLSLTAAGRRELLRRLAEPAEVEITDRNSFTVLLAFLGHLPDPGAQARVLRRRLDFYEQPSSFFYDDGRPMRAEEMSDRFRRGLLLTARATARADVRWLRDTIAELESET
jgi:DNA-binding PadR family transcriptional regulator